MTTPTPYMTVTEAAEYLRLSKTTVYKEVQDNKIAANRTPSGSLRFSKAALDGYLEPMEEGKSTPQDTPLLVDLITAQERDKLIERARANACVLCGRDTYCGIPHTTAPGHRCPLEAAE